MRASVGAVLPSAPSASFSRLAAGAIRHRWWLLGLFVVLSWAFVAVEAGSQIQHNRWVFQEGDDGPWYWTTAWTLSSLHAPITGVGLGWPYLLTPLAAVAGPNMANGLPFVLALNVVVLTPVAVVGMYLLGRRVAGELFGLAAAFAWVALPALALALYNPHNRPALVDGFLPTATGLNALADFPSVVCAIFAAIAVLRALDTDDLRDGLLAGLVLGFLVLIKPANGPLPVAAAIAFVVGARPKALVASLAGMVPALVALTLWKRTGYGYIPLLSLGETREAAGPLVAGVRPYLNFDWSHLQKNAHDLGQVFWSLRMLEWGFIAGVFGLIARTRVRGLFVAAWFTGFVLVKASASYSGVYDTSVFRFLLPAWPAWLLLVVGIGYCLPRTRTGPIPEPRRVDTRWLALTGVVLGLGPLAVAAAASPIPRDSVAQSDVGGNLAGSPVPVVSFSLQTARTAAGVRLSWQDKATGRAVTRYAVFRSGDDGCAHLDRGAPVCFRHMQMIGVATKPEFVDHHPRAGATYRIGLALGTVIQPDTPSLLLLSRPATIAP